MWCMSEKKRKFTFGLQNKKKHQDAKKMEKFPWCEVVETHGKRIHLHFWSCLENHKGFYANRTENA